MLFSSPIFIFGFLPVVLLLYYSSPKFLRNLILLSVSLMFYAWGEVFYLGVIIFSVFFNYVLGLLIYSSKQKHSSTISSKIYLLLAISVNVGTLFFFKYAGFIVENINVVFLLIGGSPIQIPSIHLPLGISFFTFQAISYLVDVFRKEVAPQKNVLNLALYISLFPQLIAGPIVRYRDVSSQIIYRSHSSSLFASGVQRFIQGLAKKTLVANSLGEVADSVFVLSGNDLTMNLAWIGIFAYTIQIYFDFSGYSDMAIGLGRLFGFRLYENFNYPYTATSLQDFWRRWHISLTSWFRDYVYIPLGGNRVSSRRVYINLLFVFVLTGFWHGAGWNFLFWGIFHGVFLVAEHAGLSSFLKRFWRPVQHLYVLIVVVIGWVFFRAITFPQAINYLRAMFWDFNHKTDLYQYAQVLSHEAVYAFFIGIFLSFRGHIQIKKKIACYCTLNSTKLGFWVDASRVFIHTSILFLSVMKVASSTYNPFIYFRF